MKTLSWVAAALALSAIVYGALLVVGSWRWRISTRALVVVLKSGARTDNAERYNPHSTAALPAPVRRYFERVLTDGQPIIRSAEIDMRGLFNMNLEKPRWKPFTSSQYVVTRRPGFVWSALIEMFPGVPIRVHDAYVMGEGVLRPALFGLLPLGGERGVGEIARGELMRWLAESVWYPTVLLPGQGVEWQAVDSASALAEFSDGPITLTMLFRFRDDGLVSGIRVEQRCAIVAGESLIMPWEGRFSDYRDQNGMLVPFFGEVAWITPKGEKSYFRGSVTRMVYRFT